MDKGARARRNRGRGKDTEKRACKALGFRRVGVMGSEDGFKPGWSMEVKSRQSFIGDTWMKQAEVNEKKDRRGGPPRRCIVVCALTKQHIENALVMVRMKDWKELQLPEVMDVVL